MLISRVVFILNCGEIKKEYENCEEEEEEEGSVRKLHNAYTQKHS